MPFRLSGLIRNMPFRDAGRGPLGVDIGSSAVKLLRWPGQAGETPDYAIRPLPAGAVADRNIRDAQAVGRCIAEAAATLRAPGRRAVAAVPSSAVMQRTLAMEAEMTDADIEAQIMVEADRHIPYPMDEVRFDFRRLDDRRHAAGTILLSVCRKEHVDSRELAIECAGLRAVGIDAEHCAVERAWRLLAPNEAAPGLAAVADIGADAICLYVLADGRSIHNGERPFDGRERHGGELESLATDIARQIGQALQLFHSSSRQGQVENLYLCGAAASAEGLAERTQDLLGMPALAANPFPGANGGRVAQDAPALLLAAGLACR